MGAKEAELSNPDETIVVDLNGLDPDEQFTVDSVDEYWESASESGQIETYELIHRTCTKFFTEWELEMENECVRQFIWDDTNYFKAMPPSSIERLSVITSQALAAVITIFDANLYTRMDVKWLKQIEELGFLVQFESLLSTRGHENGMLEDMIVAVEQMACVRIKLTQQKTTASLVKIFDARDPPRLIVHVGVSDAAWKICEPFKDHLFVICPVLFSQGINEAQTVANTLGAHHLQDNINIRNFPLIKRYAEEYSVYVQHREEVNNSLYVEKCLSGLKSALGKRKDEKNVDILLMSEMLTHAVQGGRLTSCKSAKDRTSMAVTYEQCVHMFEEHYLQGNQQFSHLDSMRDIGVRRMNVQRNTNKNRYAFNLLQLATLPKFYRPPKFCCGGVIS